MRHCFLCGGDFPDETRMVMARGSNICVPCSQTPRGKLAMPHEKTDGYYPGSGRKGDGLRKSIAREQWKERHGENTPMPKK